MRRSRRKLPHPSGVLCLRTIFRRENRRRTQHLMHEAKKGIPDVALSAQYQASRQPESFSVGLNGYCCDVVSTDTTACFNRFGVI
jgi:hypothetical protein